MSIKYVFKSYVGIKINNHFYEHIVKNLKKLNLKKTFIKNIYVDKFKLNKNKNKNKKYVIYFSNPFKKFILKILKNNYKLIKKIIQHYSFIIIKPKVIFKNIVLLKFV